MFSTTTLVGSSQRSYQTIVQRPVSPELEWRHALEQLLTRLWVRHPMTAQRNTPSPVVNETRPTASQHLGQARVS
jgi:hypothetical protein